MIVGSFLLILYHNMTNGQTDRQTQLYLLLLSAELMRGINDAEHVMISITLYVSVFV